MTCEFYLELISAALDQELTESEQKLLDEHLNDCQSCRSQFDHLRKQSRLLSASFIPAQPKDLQHKIRLKIPAISQREDIESLYSGHLRFQQKSDSTQEKSIRSSQLSIWRRS